MATYTPNFDLRKPAGSDSVSVEDDLNENWDKVDAHAHNGTYVAYAQLASLLDALITGTVTRDANGAATSAPVVWPDGSPGTYTATTLSTLFPGAVDAYTVTYGSPVTRTYTQPAVTRDASGAVTVRPAIVVT